MVGKVLKTNYLYYIMYKFNNNLLSLSNSDEISVALKEWEIVKECHNIPEVQCICQRRIKNAFYLFNGTTNKFCIVGTKCKTKFNLHFETMINNTYKQVLTHLFEKGVYDTIDNTVEYSEQVKQQLIEYLSKPGNEKNKIQEIEYLIETYKFAFLNDILDKHKTTLLCIKCKTREGCWHCLNGRLCDACWAEHKQQGEKHKQDIIEITTSITGNTYDSRTFPKSKVKQFATATESHITSTACKRYFNCKCGKDIAIGSILYKHILKCKY